MSTCDPVRMNRRDVFRGLGAGMVSLSGAATTSGFDRCDPSLGPRAAILLVMVGGPSPWESFDPKPDASREYRGPFGSIPTAVPGVRVVEHLPEIARRMADLTLVRSLYHAADPTHEAALRLLLTGSPRPGAPMLGSLLSQHLGARGNVPPFVVLPEMIGHVGGPERFDRSLGTPGVAFEPFFGGRRVLAPALDRAKNWVERQAALGLRIAADSPASPDPEADRRDTRERFGTTAFGRNCRLACQFVTAGTRLVVVTMASGVFDQPSWDSHGKAPFGTFDDYARDLLPAFDRGFSGLIDTLDERGLLESTLVVATGEFGRHPRINESGGRDHWPAVASALIAGGGTPGGQVIGASTHDGHPADRPIPLADLVATLGVAAGLDLGRMIGNPGLADAAVIREILG